MRNWRSSALAAGAIAITMVAAGSFSVAESTGEGLIKYRQAVMSGQGAHIGAISRIVKGEAEHPEHLLAHARALNDLSHMTPEAFMENVEGAENRALPLIWEDWDGFVAKATESQDAIAALVAAAETGDMAAIGAALGPVGSSCGGCHETYRSE